MDRITVNAPAKINLSLDVTGRRPDGYHELRTVFQSIALSDTLTLERLQESGIRLMTDAENVPADEGNLAVRAAMLLFHAFSLPGGLSITLEKRIPVAAGLAGGSADAAGVLYAMNLLYGLEFSRTELEKFALILGSDVPFLLFGGSAYATGRGEALTPLPDLPVLPVILGNPGVPVSTKAVFQAFDERGSEVHPDAEAMAGAFFEEEGEARTKKILSLAGNTLEPVTASLVPAIAAIKAKCLEKGAFPALMSGSGGTVYAVYENAEKAQNSLSELRSEYPDAGWILTSTGIRGIEVI